MSHPVVEKKCIECGNSFLTWRKVKECQECNPRKHRMKRNPKKSKNLNERHKQKQAAKQVLKVKQQVSMTSSDLLRLDPMKWDKVLGDIQSKKVHYVG